MQIVTLTPKRSPTISIEAENITPDAFAGKSAAEIGAIGAREGNEEIKLADIFDVAVDGSADAAGTKIIIEGDALDYLGEHLCGGEIIVKGNVRLLAGVLNWGGTITIEGDTTLPGGEMKSGTIFVKGKVLEMLPSYKDEGTDEVDGVMYRKYTGDLSRNGEGVLYVSV